MKIRFSVLFYLSVLCLFQVIYFRGGSFFTPTSIADRVKSSNNNPTYWELISSSSPLSELSNDNLILDKVLEKLQTTSFRYYVYDNPNITRLDLRQRAMLDMFTWRPKWGVRFKEFSKWEVRYLQALEESTYFRTYNASQADFVLIPIPWCAIFTAGSNTDIHTTLEALFHEPLFQANSNKHVTFTFLEFLFDKQFGLTNAEYQVLLQKDLLSVARNYDSQILDRISQDIWNKGYWAGMGRGNKMHTRRGFSVSWMGAATDDEDHHHHQQQQTATNNKNNTAWRPLSMEFFVHNKSLHFFYQTFTGNSVNNSTQFRHAVVHEQEQELQQQQQENQTAEEAAANALSLLQPSSIGWGLPPAEWWHQFGMARFCLVIRGDNPASRSLWRAIRHGCIPAVVSDTMPYYAPAFRSLIQMSDYAVMVNEFDYLRHPAQTLNDVILNLTQNDIQAKINGVNVMQRLIMPQHPNSLFAQAFGREALLSFTDEYYAIQGALYGEQFNTSYYAQASR